MKFPRSSKQKLPSRREVLALRPVRNPDLQWEEKNGKIVLTIPRRDSWKTRILNIFVPVPQSRNVELDDIGSEVWNLLDGQNTVSQITKALAKKYKLESREAEMSLQQYFQELARRGYVAFLKNGAP